ncbi:MAG: hypothetical protein JO253_07995 [Alphaproteobacteria bacterium]|nr:hypothetical protein [Alphaproteobacteria bacterium]
MMMSLLSMFLPEATIARFVPYKLLIEIIGIVLLAGAFYVALSIHDARKIKEGEAITQAKWDQDKLQRAAAQAKADADQEERFQKMRTNFQQHNQEVSDDHQKAVDELNAKLVAARANVRAAGGLRIPSAGLCDGSGKAGTETHGTSGRDADAAGTVALPEQTANDLLSLADEADRVTEIARSCQAWIRKQGFYGD